MDNLSAIIEAKTNELDALKLDLHLAPLTATLAAPSRCCSPEALPLAIAVQTEELATLKRTALILDRIHQK